MGHAAAARWHRADRSHVGTSKVSRYWSPTESTPSALSASSTTKCARRGGCGGATKLSLALHSDAMHSVQLITSPFSKSHGSERFAVRAPFITAPVTPARSSDSPRFPKPWPPIASVRSRSS